MCEVMKLVKLPSGYWINPDMISRVYIRTNQIYRSPRIYKYTVIKLADEEIPFSNKEYDDPRDAEKELEIISDYIERYLSNSTVQKKVEGILK